jgi:hypothetical protein
MIHNHSFDILHASKMCFTMMIDLRSRKHVYLPPYGLLHTRRKATQCHCLVNKSRRMLLQMYIIIIFGIARSMLSKEFLNSVSVLFEAHCTCQKMFQLI